jgi:hypothetical protein
MMPTNAHTTERALAAEARDSHDAPSCELPCKIRLADAIDRLCDEGEAQRKEYNQFVNESASIEIDLRAKLSTAREALGRAKCFKNCPCVRCDEIDAALEAIKETDNAKS